MASKIKPHLASQPNLAAAKGRPKKTKEATHAKTAQRRVMVLKNGRRRTFAWMPWDD